MLDAIKQEPCKNDQHNLLYHAQISNLIIDVKSVTGFQDLQQRYHENSKVAEQPEGPARVERWRRVLRTIE